MTSIATMLREVVVTLKEEHACLKLWSEGTSANEDVRQGIEISLSRISKALGKLASLEKGSAAEESYAERQKTLDPEALLERIRKLDA